MTLHAFLSRLTLLGSPALFGWIVLFGWAALLEGSGALGAERPPNIVYVMADDLGYGDLGCYGQTKIKTPRIDQMAAEGMRFTQFYAGSTVCAPSRCVLMTGQHTGHCLIRGNRRLDLRPRDVTVAELLHGAGYATAIIGKWGLGREGSSGIPTRQGFDYFFGYLDQWHAHNYYPTFLWRNEKRVELDNIVKGIDAASERRKFGLGYASRRVQYSHDLIIDDALNWIDANHADPFFLYLAPTIPHANNEATGATGSGQEVPDWGIYAGKDWPSPDKGQAAMISRLDRDIGRILDRLQEHQIDDKTIVMFTSDNGHHREGGNRPEFFDANGPLRGKKRDLYEGGIRVPLIVRWPEKIAAGSESDHVGYFGDLMATAAELAQVKPPQNLDSISFVPSLLASSNQESHDYLYWEFYESAGRRAVRMDDWKGVRSSWNHDLELYNLDRDLGETTNVASDHPEVVRRLATIMDEAHIPSEHWKVPQARPSEQ